jgi:hypothetical protein
MIRVTGGKQDVGVKAEFVWLAIAQASAPSFEGLQNAFLVFLFLLLVLQVRISAHGTDG